MSALTVPCPYCAAPVDQPCVARDPSVGFVLVVEPHRQRERRALGLDTVNTPGGGRLGEGGGDWE